MKRFRQRLQTTSTLRRKQNLGPKFFPSRPCRGSFSTCLRSEANYPGRRSGTLTSMACKSMLLAHWHARTRADIFLGTHKKYRRMQEHPPEEWLRDFVVDRLAATKVASTIHDGPLLGSKRCEGTAFVDGIALSALKFARVVAVFLAASFERIGRFLKFHGNIFSHGTVIQQPSLHNGLRNRSGKLQESIMHFSV